MSFFRILLFTFAILLALAGIYSLFPASKLPAAFIRQLELQQIRLPYLQIVSQLSGSVSVSFLMNQEDYWEGAHGSLWIPAGICLIITVTIRETVS